MSELEHDNHGKVGATVNTGVSRQGPWTPEETTEQGGSAFRVVGDQDGSTVDDPKMGAKEALAEHYDTTGDQTIESAGQAGPALSPQGQSVADGRTDDKLALISLPTSLSHAQAVADGHTDEGVTARAWRAGVSSAAGALQEQTIQRARAKALRVGHAPRVSVVIPTLNEAKNLPHVFPHLPADLHEVILVDGYSTDDTVAVARALRPTIRIVEQTRRGKGNALSCGFAACTGDIVVMLDADGSAHAAEIPRFVEALQRGTDFAKGSRFIPGGGSADITWTRRLGNWGLTQVVNVLYGTRYSDLCYGYNAFWSYCLPYMDVNCDGFEVETLINVRIAKAGLQVHEVPSFEDNRIHGVSNLNALRDGWRVLKIILLERFGRTELPVVTPHPPSHAEPEETLAYH